MKRKTLKGSEEAVTEIPVGEEKFSVEEDPPSSIRGVVSFDSTVKRTTFSMEIRGELNIAELGNPLDLGSLVVALAQAIQARNRQDGAWIPPDLYDTPEQTPEEYADAASDGKEVKL